jgi:hypothetical protein
MDLQFIDDKILYDICKNVIFVIEKASLNIDKNLHKNIIDPFSAIFDASFKDISLSKWVEQEKSRQIQKTFQNAIGNFHQKVLGSIRGWKNLEKGNVADVLNEDKKIIAEVKNKFNTTKGNHKIAIYDDLEELITNKYKGYVGYYVAILTKKRFDKAFTPSDNKKHIRRSENEKIREIDGATFYDMATGEKDAAKKLYHALPAILADITKANKNNLLKDPLFEEFFEKAFK